MFFDTSFVYEIQNMVFQVERMAIGGMVVIAALYLLRFALWALFSLNMNRVFASLSANLVTGVLALAVFTQPGVRDAAIGYGYALACSLGFGATGGLPDLSGGIENMVNNMLDGVMSQIRDALSF